MNLLSCVGKKTRLRPNEYVIRAFKGAKTLPRYTFDDEGGGDKNYFTIKVKDITDLYYTEARKMCDVVTIDVLAVLRETILVDIWLCEYANTVVGNVFFTRKIGRYLALMTHHEMRRKTIGTINRQLSRPRLERCRSDVDRSDVINVKSITKYDTMMDDRALDLFSTFLRAYKLRGRLDKIGPLCSLVIEEFEFGDSSPPVSLLTYIMFRETTTGSARSTWPETTSGKARLASHSFAK